MNQIPLLFIGDNPALQGGLSRIGRDIAIISSQLEEFRVGFLGRGGMQSSKLPFAQYTFPEYEQWGENWLEEVWYDFAKDDYGIVMSIWDPSRMFWFGNPVAMPNEQWLRNPPFHKWGYFPIDSESVDGGLSILSAEALKGYNRVLAYGMFGSAVMEKALGTHSPVQFLPHGLNFDTFQPRDPEGIKLGLGVPDNAVMIGVVMTNQERKDWALAFDTIARLKKMVPNLYVWCKSDSIDRHWDLRALAADFHVQDVVKIQLEYLTDKAMSHMYSACEATFLPSLGEGFGYPIVESLACGTPCMHGNYAGGAELIPNLGWLIDPVTFRYETRHNCKRPVYNPQDWADGLYRVLQGSKPVELCRGSVEYLDWKLLKPAWVKWFKDGIATKVELVEAPK